jgi:hypothetical protein
MVRNAHQPSAGSIPASRDAAGGRDLEHPPLAVQVGLAGCHGTFTILVLINDLLWQSMQPATLSPVAS